ncbi:cation channel sperm-associated protein 2-like [Osmia bicornis bicornis]|uniref:cation channel sperm-associated protein 2-like n=1 Tax=Osmia bicornis bicornis TaxID=1437191 RepID=UPI0010F58296|nr:cation channel sperm-associated protein 2-like [Osmia bicornis bicornis]
MGLTAVKALCDCNGTSLSTRQTLECYVSGKDLLPSCVPILKATVRTRCSARRMLISSCILIIIMAIIYCMSFANLRRPSLYIPFRRQSDPQPAADSHSPSETTIQASEDTAEDAAEDDTEDAAEDDTEDAAEDDTEDAAEDDTENADEEPPEEE